MVHLDLSRSSFKVKVIGQSSQLQLENGFSAMDAFESLKSYVTAAKSRSKLETINK